MDRTLRQLRHERCNRLQKTTYCMKPTKWIVTWYNYLHDTANFDSAEQAGDVRETISGLLDTLYYSSL